MKRERQVKYAQKKRRIALLLFIIFVWLIGVSIILGFLVKGFLVISEFDTYEIKCHSACIRDNPRWNVDHILVGELSNLKCYCRACGYVRTSTKWECLLYQVPLK